MSKLTKKFTRFRPMIYSRHPSHDILRFDKKLIELLPYKSLVRLGSTTDCPDTKSNGGDRIEINTIQSIKNSASKLLMKQIFTGAGVKTATWFRYNGADIFVNKLDDSPIHIDNIPYPIVAKSHFGSKGKGNTLLKTKDKLTQWLNDHNDRLNQYIFEEFMNYALEYRLHITEEGCFYACRKALKQGVNAEDKWRRHDDICVWFLEESPNFLKPNTWDNIIEDCVKSLKEIGADILSFDVKVQSANDATGKAREVQDYILLECNSASSMDNGSGNISICAQKYIEEIPKIIKRKANE